MSLLKADLPSDPEALKAFAPALQAELYVKTLHLEKLKAQLAVLKRARYERSSEKLNGEIEQLELTIGELEEGVAESQARTAAAAQTSDAKPPRPRRETSGRQPLPEHLPRETAQHPAACVRGERRYRARSAAG
jgi:hypothetical protein